MPSAWAVHQLVHACIVLLLFTAGYSVGIGFDLGAAVCLGGAGYFAWRAHKYHHARSDVGDHD